MMLCLIKCNLFSVSLLFISVYTRCILLHEVDMAPSSGSWIIFPIATTTIYQMLLFLHNQTINIMVASGGMNLYDDLWRD